MRLGPLVEILENPEIIKTGVAIKDDLKNLNKIEDIEPQGFEDLATLAKSLKIEQTGLRNLTAIFLSKDYPNPPSFPTGKNDRLPHLRSTTLRQMQISRELYLIMKARLKRLD